MITGVERDISQSDRERVRALAQKWWAAKAARRETKAIDQLPLSNLETAPGAVDDALERADLNAAEPPPEGVGAIERHHAPSVAAPSRYRPSQSWSLERVLLRCPRRRPPSRSSIF